MAGTFLMIALLGAVGSLTAVGKLSDTSRETAFAVQAARAQMERLQAESFADVFERYNDEPADDPDGPGTAPGQNFDVVGLDAQDGDADGMAGRVILPLSPGTTLREDLVDASFGLPRDLNGDGAVDALDHASDHVLLPVRVRVEWRGQTGDSFVEFATLLGMRR